MCRAGTGVATGCLGPLAIHTEIFRGKKNAELEAGTKRVKMLGLDLILTFSHSDAYLASPPKHSCSITVNVTQIQWREEHKDAARLPL